jgi:TonB family protein
MHDLHPMNIRFALPLLAFLATPALFAQGGTTTPEPVRVEERVVGDETITVEPMRVDEPAHDANEVMTVVEEMPEFPRGQEALMKYLSSKIKYPEEAMQDGIEGAVFISFVVEEDGRISNVKALRGLGGGLTEEAIRVIKGMPNWMPGKQAGKAVRVQYNLPIRFKL